MVLAIESKVYVPPSVIKSPADTQKSARGVVDSPEILARAFIDSFPKELREQPVKAPARDSQKHDNSGRGKGVQQDSSSAKSTVVEGDFEVRNLGFDPLIAPQYSSPSLSPGAALLQAQLSSDLLYQSDREKFSDLYISSGNNAYIKAGAQPGGQAAAFAASVQRDEQAKVVQILRPVLTSLNISI